MMTEMTMPRPLCSLSEPWKTLTEAGEKPDRHKSPEPAEAVVLGVHVKDDEKVGCSQMEVELEFLGDPKDLDRTG